MVVTIDSIYLSKINGERVRINRTSASVVWTVAFGDLGYAMALSSDETYLLAGAKISSTLFLGKLSSFDGSVVSSYSTSLNATYNYILVSDSRALCFTDNG